MTDTTAAFALGMAFALWLCGILLMAYLSWSTPTDTSPVQPLDDSDDDDEDDDADDVLRVIGAIE